MHAHDTLAHMHTALRAGVLLFLIAGVAAGAVFIFATDPVEAPETLNGNTMTFSLTSSAFTHGGTIPARFTCDGENTNPPLAISDVPEGTQSLALIMDDPDVPKQLKPDGVFDHWTIFNIALDVREIKEGETLGTLGMNGAGKKAYTGPCPPTQYGPTEHRYFFRLYALDTMLELQTGATKQEVLAAMEGHTLGTAELVGKYDRKQ